MKKSKAFTLIELLVVIAIIALLLAILMPSLKLAKEHAKRLLCGKDLSTIGVALAMYANQEDDYLPPANYIYSNGPIHSYYFGDYAEEYDATGIAALNAGPASARLKALLSMRKVPGGIDPDESGGPYNLGYLMRADLIDRSVPEIFYCTSNKFSRFSFQSHGGKNNWPICPPPEEEWLIADLADQHRVSMSYSYLPQHRYKKSTGSSTYGFPATAKKYSEMDPSRAVVWDLLNGADRMAHRSAGYIGINILYGDGSVLFRRDEDNIIKSKGNVISRYINPNAKRDFREVIAALE